MVKKGGEGVNVEPSMENHDGALLAPTTPIIHSAIAMGTNQIDVEWSVVPNVYFVHLVQ